MCFTDPRRRLSLSDEVPTASALLFTLISYPTASASPAVKLQGLLFGLFPV